MSLLTIGLSDSIRNAFETSSVIGVKVIDRPVFMERLTKKLQEWQKLKKSFGGFELELGNIDPEVVSFGIGRRHCGLTAHDFHIRMVDGQPIVFLKRGHALHADTVTCRMLTRAGHLEFLKFEPGKKEELNRVRGESHSHYLTEIIDAGPRAPCSSDKFIATLIKDSKSSVRPRYGLYELVFRSSSSEQHRQFPQ